MTPSLGAVRWVGGPQWVLNLQWDGESLPRERVVGLGEGALG